MSTLRLNFVYDEDSEAARYFHSCARIRKIHSGALVRRLLTVILQDQLIESILDDDGAVAHHKGEWQIK